MRDQYGKTIPHLGRLTDLYSVTLTPEEVEEVIAARWYTNSEARGFPRYLVALDDLHLTAGYVDEADDVPAGLDRIAEALKRYSVEDGFYNA